VCRLLQDNKKLVEGRKQPRKQATELRAHMYPRSPMLQFAIVRVCGVGRDPTRGLPQSEALSGLIWPEMTFSDRCSCSKDAAPFRGVPSEAISAVSVIVSGGDTSWMVMAGKLTCSRECLRLF
jgi:hypothetical protein